MSFGPFRVLPSRRQLFENDRPVDLGSRAFDILITLIEQPGQVLGRQELMARAWPDTFVGEGSLRTTIAALRQTLGDGKDSRRYIVNVPGRGYCFVAPVSVENRPPPSPGPAATSHRPAEMPVGLQRMVGRAEVVAQLADQLLAHRFVTIVGPGGIGKTTVAVAVADRLLASFRDGVHFIDVASVTDPDLVPSALAARLGVGVRSGDPMPSLLGFLGERELLILLDSCEQAIDAVAALAERISTGAAEIRILATSREALRVEGEHVHRLAPLPFPTETVGLDAEAALAYPSVQLFVDRATAGNASYAFGDDDAPVVADICGKLDGMALAIEIAAGWVDAFGVDGLAARLTDRFQLLMRGRRTALPRHQTLGATLDWSYAQLPELERRILRRLAVFIGAFTLQSACAVLTDDGTAETEAIDAIANLVSKSLLSADIDRKTAAYRLFDVTRAYGLAKLEESGERETLARRHAAHYLELLRRSQSDWETLPLAEWLDRYRHHIDNVRAALDWAFSPSGDPATGIALTVTAIPLWFALSLVSECAERIDRALSATAGHEADAEMRLNSARAWSLMQTRGFVGETDAAWSRVLALAEQRGDVDFQLRALWGLWAGLQNRGQLRPALALAECFSALAARHPDPADALVGDRMVGYMRHLLGDQAEARQYLERMVDRYEAPVAGGRIIRYVFDQRATAQCFLARILWLQGLPDRATRLTRSLVDGARAHRDVLSLCQILVQGACPVAFLAGDLDAAEGLVALLLEQAERQALAFWRAYGRCFQAILAIRRGPASAGAAMLQQALAELREIQFGVFYGVFLTELAEGMRQAGRPDEGLAAIEEALRRAERNDERWYLPEMLRMKGTLLLARGGHDDAGEAERHLHEALDWSRRQQTPAWALRAATSLAQMHHDTGRIEEGHRRLAPIVASFHEGLDTSDLRTARQLLSALAIGRGGDGTAVSPAEPG